MKNRDNLKRQILFIREKLDKAYEEQNGADLIRAAKRLSSLSGEIVKEYRADMKLRSR